MVEGPRGRPGALCTGSSLLYTTSSGSCIGWGRDGVVGDFPMGQGLRRVPEFVWQLDTVKDEGPCPIASPLTPEDPHPACFGPDIRDCLDENSKAAGRISGGLGGTWVCGFRR